ncbi:insulinase family protein [Parabacteroides sp. OttesenSCG-928-K15]|nr:insulinase family protein [Parabacteroides sp. OttesenSCG-928-K15]
MKLKFLFTFLFMGSLLFGNLSAQGLKGFKLPNGLTVYIWEDDSKPDVFGMVGVNVGAKTDPANLTGLAHYLEHVLFKGTEKIGTADWEKEKPLYEQIIAQYDKLAATQDAAGREAISKEINRLTVEAAQYMVGNEFSALTEEMGGNMLNAQTGYDFTRYFSSFPASEIYRWLELNSERFINPVFRAFQSELETVYEEYNMGKDEQGSQMQEFMLSNIFPGHPYARTVVGEPEHLKNPQLSKLIEFYNTWYVPENMVLILVGNVKASQVRGIIQDKFGRLPAKQVPQPETYPDWNVKGRKVVSAKMSPYPMVRLAFKGVPKGHPDEIPLEICMSILSNTSHTGLLDKLQLDGDLMATGAGLLDFKDQGRVIITAIPYFDISQRRFGSLRDTEKTLWKEINKLQEGNIEEWLLQSIKSTMIRQFDLAFESSMEKAFRLLDVFINNQEVGEMLAYKERVGEITLDEIKSIAKKYLTDDFIVLDIQEGKAPKAQKLEKPGYDPITPLRNTKSEYAKTFATLPVMKKEPVFCDFNEVQRKKVNDLSELFYTTNKENDIFTLTLKYGIGTRLMPKLEYAVQLMNNAGVMGLYEPQGLKQAFSELGASCRFRVDGSYLYVIMEGYEESLQESCNLLTRQILMPKLDEKQLNNIIGGEMQSRMREKDYVESVKDAASDYLFYQNNSDYLDRLPLDDIRQMTVSSLTGEFSRATDYEAEIHYVGALPFENVYDILSQHLPLKANERPTTSPEVKERVSYNENTVLFLPESDAQQSGIYFYMNGKPYDIKNKVLINALNQYMAGGFNGIIIQEIREYRSMAYSTYGYLATPPLPGKECYFTGFIGTQPDKTVEAIDIFMSLINDLPQYPERIDNIKEYLSKTLLNSRPTFRQASQRYEAWKLLGYTEDPAKTELAIIESLTFDDLMNFYNQEIKGKPMAIAIVGDPKQIDAKQLEKFGKVTRLNKNRIFSAK